MWLIRSILQHPIAVLACFAVAFVVWLWRDSVSIGASGRDETVAQGTAVNNPNEVPLLVPPPPPPFPGKKWKNTQSSSADLLARLKPGMTRAEVDGLVGIPAPEDISPVTVADGKVTYQTAYDADLGAPSTIRPLQPTKNGAAQRSRTLVTLEFDATKPGHPLLSVTFPKPLY
ncbi:hypothetical protein [Frigoriglobus tundricola]|uniref:Uncharacterized protein n=1 Tax=Frigoriglobus tundricola TaxID=2774151 RepID=A0A6M5YRJ6_9BACT|nr:hypothetical protein [Frigoriglobus tundricola]QJW96054.1 hypothetical protein FTUN_3608 [Frigoriglobus tundricola]